MKTILIALAVSFTLIAADVEPPRITKARILKENQGNGVNWVMLYIRHPHVGGFHIQQVSDGKTNQIETVRHEKPGTLAEIAIKLKGEHNVITARCCDTRTGDVTSDWSNPITVVQPKVKE